MGRNITVANMVAGRSAQACKTIALCAGLVASLAGIFWYGCAGAGSPPEPFLSSPLLLALRHMDHPAFVREVERLRSIDAPDREGMTALLTVACCGELDDLKYVLSKNPDVNRVHPFRGTPLMAVLMRRDAASAKLLLGNGADVTRVTPWGDTALLAAVRSGSAECVELILQAAPAAQHRAALVSPGMLENPLNCAASDDADEPILRRLLAAGFDPNRVGRNGQLPLVTATASGSSRCASLLITAGANPDLPDGRGRIARVLARRVARRDARLAAANPPNAPASTAAQAPPPVSRTRL
jgi:ankyrin repeat protein